MITCAECLSALSTTRLVDIRTGSPVRAHIESCERCGRIATDLQYAEHKLALALSEIGPSITPQTVATQATIGSELVRRRAIARWVRGGLVVLGVVVLGLLRQVRFGGESPTTVTENFQLRCMAPEAAVELATPYLRSDGTAVYRADRTRTVTLRGQREEVMAAMELITVRDLQTCQLRDANPSGEKQGKD